jgi:hypothetical protein
MMEKINHESGSIDARRRQGNEAMYNTTNLFMSPQPNGATAQVIQKNGYFNAAHQQSTDLLEHSTTMESKQFSGGQNIPGEVRSTSLLEPADLNNQIAGNNGHSNYQTVG